MDIVAVSISRAACSPKHPTEARNRAGSPYNDPVELSRPSRLSSGQPANYNTSSCWPNAPPLSVWTCKRRSPSSVSGGQMQGWLWGSAVPVMGPVLALVLEPSSASHWTGTGQSVTSPPCVCPAFFSHHPGFLGNSTGSESCLKLPWQVA